jgi:hypothetical protein
MQLVDIAALTKILVVLRLTVLKLKTLRIKIAVLFVQTIPFKYVLYWSECRNRERGSLWAEYFKSILMINLLLATLVTLLP